MLDRRPEPPLLSLEDFIRLARSGVSDILGRTAGLPPALPQVSEAAGLTWPELGLTNDLRPRFHERMTCFFGLESPPPPPTPGETLGGYAGRLWSAWAGQADRAIVFHTSGSTGQPRLHSFRESFLRQEGLMTAEFLKDRARVAVAVPLIHFYGFNVGLLVPKMLDIPALDMPPLPTVAASAWRGGDLLAAFPLFLDLLLQGDRPPGDVALLSAGAPCPDRLFKETRDFGFMDLLEIYGASETGAIGLRREPGPFSLLSPWRRAGQGRLARSRPEGGEAFFDVPDRLRWLRPRRFLPLGRLDQAVQVAGINVYPERVARVIREHSQVEFCLVRPMTEAEGDRLKAFVVLKPGASTEAVRRELAAEFRRRLSPPERPASLTFGAEPPRTVIGKFSDWEIKDTGG
ncbi:MAG: AMP-binding protein [Candidatus Adiutrix sp.]|jgi:4-coumarate--CoA ligase (photoactive yellow protein activation family)|nr:AMP-binding protein [Candidatus Adiutrix sp.]